MTISAPARRLPSSFVAAAATAAALLATAANAQTTTTLGASYTTTAMESSAALSTTGGLTLNLGLGFEYLIVGGGGGGGGNIGGGGGAGGVLTNVGGTAPAAVVSGSTAAVAVGSGGAGGSISNRGTSGGSSSVFTVTANGGGGGGYYDLNNGIGQTGLNGASGGGGSPSNAGGAGGGSAAGGGLGNSGGSGVNTGADGYRAGGGGGAGSAGASTSSSQKGDGGAGATSSITGASTVYAAGGGGGTNTGDNQGAGGSGIGGNGGSSNTLAATAGAANTGSGGGGGGFATGTGGAGGSGVVIVRYRSASSLTSGGDTSGSYNDGSDDWQYERFTNVSGGTLTVSALDASNLQATQSGVISGTGSLTYNGPGTLQITAANTFTGNTRVAAGTLELGNALALQNSVLDLAAADAGTVAFTVPGATTYTVKGLSGSRALDIGGNTLSLGGTATASNFSGDLSGAGGSLIKTGTGTLTLSGNNSFSGGIVVNVDGDIANSSTIVAGSATAFGTGTVALEGGNNGTGSILDVNGQTLANNITLAFTNTGDASNTGALKNTNTSTTAVLNGTLTIGGANYVGGDGDITLNGIVSGGRSNDYSLYKQGAGTWTFANEANTFDGLYYQVDGVTEVTKLANAGQTSSLGQVSADQNRFVFGFGGSTGGTLRYIGSAASSTDRAFSLNGTSNIFDMSGTTAGADLEITGVVSGGGTLTKSGVRTLTLAGTNTYTGATTVSAGTLKVGNGGTAGTLGGGGVSLAAGATLAFDRTDAGLAVANVISGNGSVVQAGSGTTTLSGANTFTGGTTISAGTLAVSAIADAGTSNLGTSGTLALAGGTLEYTAAGNATTARLVDISAANTTSAISVSDAAATLTLTNNVRNSDPTHPNVVLTKTGSGTLEIAGAGGNTGTSLVAAAGTTLLNATARAVYEIRALDTGATVRLAQPNQVFNGDAISTTGNIRMTGGTLDLDGNAQEISRLIGSTNATAGTGTITSSTAATFTVGNNLAGRPSIFDGSLTGDLALVTRGSNPITLGGASSYTGTTTVGGSRLSVNGSLGNTAVTVAAGILGGSGSIAGSVAVQSGGTLAPGNSIESLSAGATSFASGATFAYEVDSTFLGSLGTAADLLVVDGNLSIAAGSLLSFADLNQTPQAFVEDSTVFAMINYTGTWDGGSFTYNSQPLADGSRFTVGSQMWEIDYDYAYNGSNTQPLNFSGDFLPVSGTQTFVTVTAVPEPSTYLMLVIAAGMGAIAARHRRTAQA